MDYRGNSHCRLLEVAVKVSIKQQLNAPIALSLHGGEPRIVDLSGAVTPYRASNPELRKLAPLNDLHSRQWHLDEAGAKDTPEDAKPIAAVFRRMLDVSLDESCK